MPNLLSTGIKICRPILLAVMCIGCADDEAIQIARMHHAVLPPDGKPRSLKINGDQQAADAVLPLLPALDGITTIGISRVSLSDEQLQAIGGVSKLTYLIIDECGLTDEDLVHLSGLHNLRTLFLDSNAIEGDGLKHLARLGNLRTLTMRKNNLTGSGLEQLAPLQSLEELRLGDNPIDDAGIENLLPITRPSRVDLTLTEITPEGYIKLADLLWLRHIGVSDDLFGPGDNLQKRREGRKELRTRFRDARLGAVAAAKSRGMEVPDQLYFP